MQVSTTQALEALNRQPSATPPVTSAQPDLLIAGATGVSGNAVMQRLVGTHRYAHTRVLAQEPIAQGLRTLSLLQVKGDIANWAAIELQCDVAVVMFEPPRMFYDREKALWTPEPSQLTALATWLRSCGVQTLAVVMPHAQGSLPDSLKRGLASLDEHALALIGFERLLILRTAEKPAAARRAHMLERLAHWMLGIFAYMVPAQEQPVRPTKIALIVDALLQTAPRGITVLSQYDMWALAQHDAAGLTEAIDKQIKR